MADPWLALEFGADPAERIAQIGAAHEAFLNAGAAPPGSGRWCADSWRRSARRCSTRRPPPPVDLTDDALESYRAAHPLARVLPLFRDLLGGIAQDGAHLMAVCDAYGRLLWVEGHPGVLRHAERMNFVPGARWDEAHAGTNAPGTALAVDHSVQIFATEHFVRPVQRWTCAAAPIHDPATGRLLGAVDITGGDHLANPQSLALVRATARAAEAFLASATPVEPDVVTVSARSAATRRSCASPVAGSGSAAGTANCWCCSSTTPRGAPANSSASTCTATTDCTRSPCAPNCPGCAGRSARNCSTPGRTGCAGPCTPTSVPSPGCWNAATRRGRSRRTAGRCCPGRTRPGVTRLRRLIDGQLRAAVLAAADPGAARGLDRDARRGRRPGRLAGPGAGVAAGRAAPAPRRGARPTSSPWSTTCRAQRCCNVGETSVPAVTRDGRRRYP